MNRFLGTKTKILPDIKQVLKSLPLNGGRICDIFSGSLAVSLFLKRQGYGVIANDINALSFSFSQAYLIPNAIPQLRVGRLLCGLSARQVADVEGSARTLVESQRKTYEAENKYGEFKSWTHYSETIRSLSVILAFLEEGHRVATPKVQLRADIVEHYTKAGRKSHYRSLRGRSGKRNYFSLQNARRIDFILSHIRHWWHEGSLDVQAKYTLLCVLLDSMERCANTNGTYHDFPRNRYEERARQPYRTWFPNYFGLLHGRRKHWSGCEDSLQFIKRAPRHDVLYIDPPYNFRQYTAYYHLPNFIVRYPDIEDLGKYMSELEFVRGQNMAEDFTSPFSNRERFIESLDELISRARCRFVILSYFDGVNHWNRFLEEDNSRGYRLLTQYFRTSNLFRRKSLRVVPVNRTNYQSQNGHTAKKVTEYLFVAEREAKESAAAKRQKHVFA